MTDELDVLRQQLADEIATAATAVGAAAAALDRLRAASARPAPSPVGNAVDTLITPGVAVQLSGLSRAQLHRRCKKFPTDAPDGFSLLPPGERAYRISKSRLEAHLRAYPPRCYKKRRKR
jgi:hypothetical protein